MAKHIALPPPATCHRLELDPDDRVAIPAVERVRMLALMHLIRAFENRVLDLKESDLVHGPAHTSVGQEAVAAGVAAALRATDLIGSTHRAHGHFMAKALLHYAPADWDPLRGGATPAMSDAVYRTLAEISGLAAGWCGARRLDAPLRSRLGKPGQQRHRGRRDPAGHRRGLGRAPARA